MSTLIGIAYGTFNKMHTSYNIIKLTIYLIVCGNLSNPANGTVSTIGTGVGDTATYSCDNGYNLTGNDTVTCQSSGYWSGPLPICVG